MNLCLLTTKALRSYERQNSNMGLIPRLMVVRYSRWTHAWAQRSPYGAQVQVFYPTGRYQKALSRRSKNPRLISSYVCCWVLSYKKEGWDQPPCNGKRNAVLKAGAGPHAQRCNTSEIQFCSNWWHVTWSSVMFRRLALPHMCSEGGLRCGRSSFS